MNGFISHAGVRVISGGQTGVDIAGLRAAMCLGYKTGGYAPKGFKTQVGPRPQLGKFWKLQESTGGYAMRTWQNVEVSNATLIIAAHVDSPGTRMTIEACKERDIPFRVVTLEPSEVKPFPWKVPLEVNPIVEWLHEEALKSLEARDMFTLNVAGNSSTTAPGIFPPTYLYMLQVLSSLQEVGTKALGEAAAPSPHLPKLMQNETAIALMDVYEYYLDLDPKRKLLLLDGVFTTET